MRRLATSLIILLLALFSNWGLTAAHGQVPTQRFVILVLEPDFSTLQVHVYGSIVPPPEAGGLSRWDLEGLQLVRQPDRWTLEGSLPTITLQQTGNGTYLLHIDRIQLDPVEELDLFLPFASINWDGVSPAPSNLQEGQGLNSVPPALKFRVDQPSQLEISIPFSVVGQQINLAITPVLGSLITHRDPGIRVAGQVTFSPITNYSDFERYCTSQPSLNYNQSAGYLLYRLDYPSDTTNFEPPPGYELKKTSLRAVTQATVCEFQADGQSVTANFHGSVFFNPNGKSPDQDVIEQNKRLPNSDVYELHLGEVVLDPGDSLSLTMPESNLLHIRPAPTTLIQQDGAIQKVVFDGPNRFELVIQYSPRPELVLRELPSLGRSLALAAERGLTPPTNAAPDSWFWPDGVLILAGIMLAGWLTWPRERTLSQRATPWLAAAVLLLAGVGLFFLLPGVFGWLLLAVGLLAWSARSKHQNWILIGVLLVAAALAASLVNPLSIRVFSMLGLIDNQLTPLTPALLLVLAIVPAWLLLADPDRHPWLNWTAELVAPLILFFFALSAYDAFQKSLPALVASVLWGLVLGRRFLGGDREVSKELAATPELIRRVFADRWFQLAFGVLILYEGIQGLVDTISVVVVSPTLGPLGILLPPLLQVVSVVLAMGANAILFLLLYPLLPFKQGILKAITLAVLLLSLFLLGTAGDPRLILVIDKITIGRFIYYLSAPLLAGIVVDLRLNKPEKAAGQEAAGTEQTPSLDTGRMKSYWAKVEEYAGLAGGIVSLLAPSLYASLHNIPLVTNYFQLLKLLSTLG